jgi:uncharacterized membrane protein
MAISPDDLLPITAVAVGLVGRRLRLAGQAVLTLALGLAVASGAAAMFALAQDWLDLIPSGFNIDATLLGSLTTVNDETIAVALAADIAGMLALETRASSGVGVAISVTTIPAAPTSASGWGWGSSETSGCSCRSGHERGDAGGGCLGHPRCSTRPRAAHDRPGAGVNRVEAIIAAGNGPPG